MNLTQAKKALTATLVLAVTAPTEALTEELTEKAEQQVNDFGLYYKNKIEDECRKEAEKLLSGSDENLSKFIDSIQAGFLTEKV